jgi:hypothetical protein
VTCHQATLWDEPAAPKTQARRDRAAAPSRPAGSGSASGHDLLAAARAVADDRQMTARPIDYDRMRRLGPRQRSALTRAQKQGDVAKLVEVIARTVLEWDEIGCWPDDWSRWQGALDDALPWSQQVDLHDLAAAARRAAVGTAVLGG